MTAPGSWRLLVGGVAGVAILAGTAVVSELAGAGTSDVVVSTHRPRLVSAPIAAPPAVASTTGPRGRPLGVRLDEGWLRSTAFRAGIAERAVAAYGRASLAAPCAVGWTTLAGIGYVESQHGTLGGRHLRADGRPSRPIRGPALDRMAGFASVPADDGTGWARAEGPMQFLLSTWEQWGTDADGDGRADPDDLDDAARAAADYLCASGTDLATGAGWSAAVLSYNHSVDYVRAVYVAAQAYADRTSAH